MNIEEELTEEMISKIDNPELKDFIKVIKKKIVNKEDVDPTSFLNNAMAIMGTDSKNPNAANLININESAKKAMEEIKKITI
jgi:hypothetical protein